MLFLSGPYPPGQGKEFSQTLQPPSLPNYTLLFSSRNPVLTFFFKVDIFLFLFIFITQMNLSHLLLYNDHNNPISQNFHPITQAHPPTPQTVSPRDHKFFSVYESASVLQRSPVCPFFRFHMSVKALDVGVSLYG